MILTVGHSTHPIGEFIEMLRAHGVTRLVDVRTVPKSRHNPQFQIGAMPGPLAEAGIAYLHMPALGGLRHPNKDSINRAWKNASFRGYADYMQSPVFEQAIEQLLALDGVVAIMCAEAVPWRCHRSLIADALAARGVEVQHIMSAAVRYPHKMTKFAVVQDGRVTYPAETGELWGSE